VRLAAHRNVFVTESVAVFLKRSTGSAMRAARLSLDAFPADVIKVSGNRV